MIDLPSNPTLGQRYVATNGVAYTWLGQRWDSANAIQTGKAEYYVDGGDSAFIYTAGRDGELDGGVGDNNTYVTISSYELYEGYCTPHYGVVVYNVLGADATDAGVIVQGISVDYTQTVSFSYAQGENTDYLPVLDTELWNQTARATFYVVDSRGYTHYILLSDAWNVAHT